MSCDRMLGKIEDVVNNTRVCKLYPTCEMLENLNPEVVCPVESCRKVVKGTSAFSIHLSKRHPIQDKGQDVTTLFYYHCPIGGCVYGGSSKRFFPNIKYLKQHYRKVHAVQSMKCEKCNAAFSHKMLLAVHARQCGVVFDCACGKKYTSREALLTHAKRNQHAISEKFAPLKRNKLLNTAEDCFKDEELNGDTKSAPETKTVSPMFVVTAEKGCCSSATSSKVKVLKPRLLLPKPGPINSMPLTTLAAIALSELSVLREVSHKVDTSTQTDFRLSFDSMSAQQYGETNLFYGRKRGSSCTKSGGYRVKRSSTVDLGACRALARDFGGKKSRRSAETQTRTRGGIRNSKRQKTCAETQTFGNLILEKAMAEANLPILGVASKTKARHFEQQSIQTQTAARAVVSYQEAEQFTFEGDSGLLLEDDGNGQFPKNANCETQTLWNRMDQDVNMAKGSRQDNLPMLSCTDITENYPDLVRSTTSTQTSPNAAPNLRQCTSSQTERDVFLGHMDSPFSIEPSFSTLSASPMNLFHHSSNPGTGQDNTHHDNCSSVQYEDFFSSGSSKLVENRLLSSETQTELNFDMLLQCDDDERSEDGILCSNIQTQTTDDFDSIPYEQLLTNMQTQTNEDFLFPELTFSDIQTQTSWKDTAASPSPADNQFLSVDIQTQTQTAAGYETMQSINTQTQTLLTELEAGCIVFADSHTQTA